MRNRTLSVAVCCLLATAAFHAGTGRGAASAVRETQPAGSAAVDKWQGHWQAFENGSEAFTMEIEELGFHAVVDPQTWYRGKVFVRTGEIDFLIEDCTCNEKGMTADAVFEWVEDEINVWIASPGQPRPSFFELDDHVVRIFRRYEPEEEDEVDGAD